MSLNDFTSEVTGLEATLTYIESFQSDMFQRCTRMLLSEHIRW